MMAMCSNFGIEADDAEVGAEFGIKDEGVELTVLAGGTDVGIGVAEGMGAGATVVAGICVQAVNKIKRKMKKIDRIIDLRVPALGVL